MADIFLSHASEDVDRVKPLVAALEEHGWSVWWDRKLVAGPNYNKKIEQALDAARCVVVVWSKHSIESRWVQAEANEGIERDLLVPVLFDDVRPPLPFRMAQTAQLTGWPEQAGSLTTVIDGISELLGKPVSMGVQEQKPIAILPFANMSSDPENEYFSDGISEEILNTLVKTNTLPVIARTSSFKFRGEEFDATEIGEKLKVSHLIEGSVRKSGNQVRITAQLVETETGLHLWSDSYNRDITDIFAVQEEIAEKIVNQIGIALPTGQDDRPAARSFQGTKNTNAYKLYLQAKHLANTGNPFEVEKAIPLYEQAVELDPEFADAWVELGITHVNLAGEPLALRIPAETNPIAIDAFKTALEIDPRHARALCYLGLLRIVHEYQWNEGLHLLEQSISLNPLDAQILAWYGYVLTVINHPDANAVLEKAYLLSPFDLWVVMFRAIQIMVDGRLADGVALMETAAQHNQTSYDANILAAYFSATIGNVDIAEGYLSKARAVVGSDYPAVKAIDALILTMRADERANALKVELLEVAAHTRVGFLMQPRMQWSEMQLKQVTDIALSQRYSDVLVWLVYKPPRISDSDWTRFQVTTRLAEAQIETRSMGGLDRSEEEKTQLKLEAISMTGDELDSHVGVFESPNSGVQVSVEREGNHLRVVSILGNHELVPMASHHFEIYEIKASYYFTVEGDSVTHIEVQVGQLVHTYIRKA